MKVFNLKDFTEIVINNKYNFTTNSEVNKLLPVAKNSMDISLIIKLMNVVWEVTDLAVTGGAFFIVGGYLILNELYSHASIIYLLLIIYAIYNFGLVIFLLSKASFLNSRYHAFTKSIYKQNNNALKYLYEFVGKDRVDTYLYWYYFKSIAR